MSINLETYPTQNSPHQPTITSPLFHPPSALNRSRFNPHHIRAPLETRLTISHRINSSSSGSSSAGQPKPSRLSRKLKQENEPKSSTFLSSQFRSNLEARLREEVGSPQVIEPESSSSQPSEPFSGSYKDFSPFQVHGEKNHLRKVQEDMFTEEFYKRINDFFDTEGLELADPADQMQGIRLFSKASMMEEEADGRQGEDMMYQIKGVQSANHSPKLIADNLISSTLLQRRSSRSQGPGGVLNVLSAVKKPKQGKLNVGVFRHFQDDLNQIMQTASPIEEKITPMISRNNSGFYENTPDRLGPKKFSFKHLMSPDSRENKVNEDPRFRNGLAKYIIKPTKSFKSPHLNKIGSMMSINSPLKSTKEENESFSFCSSPVMIMPSPSPKKASPNKQTARPERYVKGKVVRKSRFQTLRDLEECPPIN